MGIVFCDVGLSADGFSAGPNQSLDSPLGVGGERVFRWRFEAPDEHKDVVDAIVDAGAFVMGRNMFGPVRGEWHNWQTEWTGWWGDNPPYHGPVFVLTHYPREPLEMEGGTTFHFVTDGIESAVEQARAASNGRGVSIAGAPRPCSRPSARASSTSCACTSHR